MSLIERAVTRLGGNPPVFPTESNPADTGITAVAEEPTLSSIEQLIARTPAIEHIVAQPPSTAANRTESTSAPNSEAPIHLRLDALRRRGFVVPDGQTTRTAEEFRVIKRPLLANAFGTSVSPVKYGKRVMVTSAFPGEGKSFCAINLALSIAAERDHKVLLVDADVARPSIPREMGFKAGAGLMDLVLDPGKHNVSELVLQTDVDKLALLPSGRRHEHATELLASQGMSDLLDLLSECFPDRLIIFDSPPLLVTTEARVLATYMGQIVLVVEAGKTPKAAVTEAISTIDGAAEVVGLILNKSSGSNTGGYGYYGYGYGYGYGRTKTATT